MSDPYYEHFHQPQRAKNYNNGHVTVSTSRRLPPQRSTYREPSPRASTFVVSNSRSGEAPRRLVRTLSRPEMSDRIGSRDLDQILSSDSYGRHRRDPITATTTVRSVPKLSSRYSDERDFGRRPLRFDFTNPNTRHPASTHTYDNYIVVSCQPTIGIALTCPQSTNSPVIRYLFSMHGNGRTSTNESDR